MPMYTYRCDWCGHLMVVARRIEERNDTDTCGGCFGPMRRTWDKPILHPSAVPSRSCRGGGS